MANKNQAADTSAQGDTGSASRAGEADNTPYTQAGAPQRQDQSRTSLDTSSESGRARDEGPDAVERTGAQRPRRDPGATTSPDIEPSERETL